MAGLSLAAGDTVQPRAGNSQTPNTQPHASNDQPYLPPPRPNDLAPGAGSQSPAPGDSPPTGAPTALSRSLAAPCLPGSPPPTDYDQLPPPAVPASSPSASHHSSLLPSASLPPLADSSPFPLPRSLRPQPARKPASLPALAQILLPIPPVLMRNGAFGSLRRDQRNTGEEGGLRRVGVAGRDSDPEIRSHD
jgi:hypothetical protein